MALPEYRYQNGEAWEGPDERLARVRRVSKTLAAEAPPPPRRRGDLAARARANRALREADPEWTKRPPEERRALVARYVALEAGS